MAGSKRTFGVIASVVVVIFIAVVGSLINTAHMGRQSDTLTSISQGPLAPGSNGQGSITAGSPAQQAGNAKGATTVNFTTGHAERSALSEPLRSMKPVGTTEKRPATAEAENPSSDPGFTSTRFEGIDPLLQSVQGPLSMPSPFTTFEGVSSTNAYTPSDTTGDVGPNDYVQWVNDYIQVFSKDGVPRTQPVAGNTFWARLGGMCALYNKGDPQVVYDAIADRWLLGQFSYSTINTGPYYQCLAVSTGPDPTGSYNQYGIRMSDNQLNDAPKLAVWPDAYYLSTNNLLGGTTYVGHSAVAFDRAAMLVGQPNANVSFQKFDVPTYYGNMLPADLDGPTLPPSGSPAYFGSLGSPTSFNLFRFHVDWSNPNNSTFLGTSFPVAPFNANLCGGSFDCIPQPGTIQRLEGLSDRLMYRLVYRNMGSYESLVANHTVDVDGTNHAGIRWYEIRNPAANPYVYQQGTYAPDANHRWMGSIAMDRFGNIALGYSVSSSNTYPSIRYAGRLSTDPLGTLAQGEQTLQAGGGSQTGVNRWGDYSTMSVDPVDDCTFWYTQEYYPATSPGTWYTRIGAFRFPQCAELATPTPRPTVAPPTVVPPTVVPTTSPASPTPGTPLPTPTGCVVPFSDVQPSDYFYPAVQYLYCTGAISGYPNNTFRPYGSTTRGQLTKIVVLAENWNLYIPPAPSFSDVPPNHTFYPYIETAHHRGIVNGFPDGKFRPDDPVTRGQLCKIIVLAQGWSIYIPPSPSFSDVPSTYGFYQYIETAHYKGIISGYPDGTFHPDNHATRGQIAKIVYNAIMTP
jgi:hypothetical protein